MTDEIYGQEEVSEVREEDICAYCGEPIKLGQEHTFFLGVPHHAKCAGKQDDAVREGPDP